MYCLFLKLKFLIFYFIINTTMNCDNCKYHKLYVLKVYEINKKYYVKKCCMLCEINFYYDYSTSIKKINKMKTYKIINNENGEMIEVYKFKDRFFNFKITEINGFSFYKESIFCKIKNFFDNGF